MSVRDQETTDPRTCECGYQVQNFTFAVLHRVWAHQDGPTEARVWADKKMSASHVIPLPRKHDSR